MRLRQRRQGVQPPEAQALTVGRVSPGSSKYLTHLFLFALFSGQSERLHCEITQIHSKRLFFKNKLADLYRIKLYFFQSTFLLISKSRQ